MEEKKTLKISLSALFFLLIIIALVIIGGFVIYNNNIKINQLEETISKQKSEEKGLIVNNIVENDIKNSTNTIKNDTIDTNKNGTVSNFVVPAFSTATAKNKKENNIEYSSYVSNDYFSIEIKDGKPVIIAWDSLKDWAYTVGISTNDIQISSGNEKTITGFSKKVVDVHICEIGQSAHGTVICFIMEDGTLEYSTIQNLITKVSTQGKIEGLSNIVKIQDVSVREWWDETGGPGWNSAIAIDNQNYYYDLNDYINR